MNLKAVRVQYPYDISQNAVVLLALQETSMSRQTHTIAQMHKIVYVQYWIFFFQNLKFYLMRELYITLKGAYKLKSKYDYCLKNCKHKYKQHHKV